MAKKIYLFSGDSFLVEEKSRAVLAEAEKKYGPQLARQTFYLKDTPLESILTQARTLPFLAEFQVFLIRECEKMKKEDLEALAQYLDKAPDTASLVFESEAATEKSPLFELAVKHGQALVIEKERGRSAAHRYIEEKLRQFGKTMPPGVRRRLEDEVGDSPMFLDSILNQLILYAGEKTEITDEMLDLFEEKWAQADAFQLIDAVFSGDAARSLAVFHELTDSSDGDVLVLIGLLNWQLKRLWQAAVLLEEGQSEGAIQKKCKVFPKHAKSFMAALRRLNRGTLEEAIEKLFRLDWAVKTGETGDLMGLERWIVEMAAAGK